MNTEAEEHVEEATEEQVEEASEEDKITIWIINRKGERRSFETMRD